MKEGKIKTYVIFHHRARSKELVKPNSSSALDRVVDLPFLRRKSKLLLQHVLVRQGKQRLSVNQRIFVPTEERRPENDLRPLSSRVRPHPDDGVDVISELGPVVVLGRSQEAEQAEEIVDRVSDRGTSETPSV